MSSNSRFQISLALCAALVGCNEAETSGEASVSGLSVADGPRLTSASLQPQDAYTDDLLRVSATASSGENGAAPDIVCVWAVNGEPAGTDDCVLDGADWFDRDDVVEVDVFARNELGSSPMSRLQLASVSNTPPEPPGIGFGPTAVQAGERDLRCAVQDLFDVDGDSVKVDIIWEVDGRPFDGAVDGVNPGDTVLAADLSLGNEWTCVASAHDGTDASPASTATRLIEEPAPYDTELLSNGGFELGSLDGWTDDGLPCVLVTAEDHHQGPAEGDFYVWGGEVADDCRLSQTIDLVASGFPAGAVDAGVLSVDAGVWLAGLYPEGVLDDQASVHVRYLSYSGEVLGSVSTLVGGGESWLERGASGQLPVGTRFLEVELDARWYRGDRNDALADGASLQIRRLEPADATITLQPMLQDYRTDAMTMLWESDGNAVLNGVSWGRSEDSLSWDRAPVHTVQIDDTHFVHEVTIEGLSAGEEIFYKVHSGSSESPVWSFRTAPAAGEPVRIAWAADNQNMPEVFRQHVQNMAGQEPDLFFAPGDVVEDGDILSDWSDYWFLPLEEDNFGQTTPVLFARGNHDLHHAYARAYSALPDDRDWYAFTYGAVYVVVLDSEMGTNWAAGTTSTQTETDVGDAWGQQAAFLESALASEEAQDAAWRIVTFHQPPYTNSRHDNSQIGSSHVRDHWIDIIEAGNVDLVISGHFHAYERGTQNGTTYIVTGGGGGSLDDRIIDQWDLFDVIEQQWHYNIMDADAERLSWTTYDIDDAVLDEFVLTR